jgi:uncharacterized membrane protein
MHTVIAVTFDERAQAEEALNRLKVAGFEGRVGVRSAVLVERDEERGAALVAELDEHAVEVVDATMAELGGVVVRQDAAGTSA